ncbi:MAG: type II toxin-antitoxin system RelE/ParE family toxin [Methylomonas sp.]|nr:type II toxin-antitoxin system RelE/ParE family toxin [Methylomonas sp.]
MPNDLKGFIDSLYAGEIPGERLQHVGQEVYKARIKNTDNKKGKSGGYRIIYFLAKQEQIFLVTLYAKSIQEDVSNEKILAIIEDCQQE